MKRKRLREALEDRSRFVLIVELTGGPQFSFGPIEAFLKAYKSASVSSIPDGFDFVGITSPHNPGGTPNIETANVLSHIKARSLLGDLDFIPHISCKDQNRDALVSSLRGFGAMGVETVLVITGDKPVKGKGVFELESIGLLEMTKKMNSEQYLKARPETLDHVHQFFAGAVVSPFKYTEASQMQQYYKMEKKIASGARFLIPQVGWDWKKSLELFRYLEENNLHVPVIGNVFFLSTTVPAPRLMHDIKLPGCFVSDQLLEKLYAETIDDHLERAAQQVAMYKAMGAAGVDIAGVHDFSTLTKILTRAAEIGPDWEQFKDNLCWPAKDTWYLYDQAGKRTRLSRLRMKLRQRFFNFFHRAVLNPDHWGFHALKNTMAFLGAQKGKGFVYKLFNASERAFKYLMFDCEACGDCYLPENFSWCTIGDCEKGMDNAPCGDSTVEGYCGNNLELVCIGEPIYRSAAAEKNGLEKLRATICRPRNHALEDTASVLNYLFGKDHTVKNPLISIGELIRASIPKTGRIMKQLAELGPDAYSRPSGPLNYIKALIESQASEGADYIAVNLDALGESDPQVAIDMMLEYVRMVRQWGGGVPVCIDSSNDDALIAALKEWYSTDQKVARPLLNSVKVYTVDNILPMKKDFDFAFVGLLVSEQAAAGLGVSHSVDELYSLAGQIFEAAVKRYGFKPHEIFFDCTVSPLVTDSPKEPNIPSCTYRAFETIKKIKSDPELKGVHCSLGISDCVRDLAGRRIGVCRAYVAKAMEYGLDAGIVNVAHHYGLVKPAPDLLELVDAYANMDGSPGRMNKAATLMSKFREENRKPRSSVAKPQP
ncbi:MAG: methylenetetrahydrofolate reductase C-terminal domain-containing protein [Planctomycetota bacterium]|jgi:methylenetetrahydrofolate reductase (NADPH)